MNTHEEIQLKLLKKKEAYAKWYYSKGIEYRKKYREKNRERINVYQKERRTTKKGKDEIYKYNNSEIGKERSEKHRSSEKYKQKHKAHNVLQRAVKSNVLIKKNCEWCGNKKSEAHHEDYTKPLDVIWLCRSCHFIRHQQINAIVMRGK
jgi:hypothetical protein